MRARLFPVFLAFACSGASLLAVPYQFDFASLASHAAFSRIQFDGNSDTFSFQHSDGFDDFVITNSDFGDLNGLSGGIAGTFQIGAVSSVLIPGIGLVQEAAVTGLGHFSIRDGSDRITADLTWTNIQTLGTFGGGLNTSGILNLSNFSDYSGTNQRLQSFAANGGAVVLAMSFQDTNLSSLVADGSAHGNDFSGSVIVEARAVADSPLGFSVAALLLGVIAAARRLRRNDLAA